MEDSASKVGLGLRVYVASSWRNPWQQRVVAHVRDLGFEVYDFRNPGPGDHGFRWTEGDPNCKRWTPEQYREGLKHPVAQVGLNNDTQALRECDICILVQPCGTSSHLELGHAIGAGKRSAVLFPNGMPPRAQDGHSVHSEASCSACGDLDGCHLPGKLNRIEPELMPGMADAILVGGQELSSWCTSTARKIYQKEAFAGF